MNKTKCNNHHNENINQCVKQKGSNDLNRNRNSFLQRRKEIYFQCHSAFHENEFRSKSIKKSNLI